MPPPPEVVGSLAAVMVNMQSVRIDCGNKSVTDCMCFAGVYKLLDGYLRDIGLTRRRLNAYSLPEGCLPIVYSDELLLYNGEPVVLLSIQKNYNAEMRRIEVDVDIKEVHDGDVKRWLCRFFPNTTACKRRKLTLEQFLP